MEQDTALTVWLPVCYPIAFSLSLLLPSSSLSLSDNLS